MTTPSPVPTPAAEPDEERAPGERSSLRHGRMRWQAIAVAVVAVLVAVFGLVAALGGTASVPATDTSLGAQALENLSPFERHVLADKHVTAEEMDEALHTYTDCLSEAGIRYEIQPGSRGMGNVFTLGGPANGWPSGTEQDFDAVMDRCVDEISAVQNVWILQNHAEGTYPQPLPGLQEALDALDTSGW